MLSFNVWGLRWFSKHKRERINAIGNEIMNGEYDLYLLQELWMEDDYNTTKRNIQASFHMTNYKVGSLMSTCVNSLGKNLD